MIAKLYFRVLKKYGAQERKPFRTKWNDELLEGHAQFQNIDSVGVLKLLLCGRHWTELKESDTNKTSRMLDSVQKGKLQHWKQECVNTI